MSSDASHTDHPEWDPADPDVDKVYYDLADWSIDQQAAVSALFAEHDVPHQWEGFEVVVPWFVEDTADALFEQLEARFGLSGPGEAVPWGPDDPATEYDLADWSPAQRATLVRAVADAGIPHRVEDSLLLVPVAAESVVDELLDAVESGDVMLLDEADGEEPALGMAELFTMADRLRREPKDSRGRDLLELALTLDAERPPYGVALVTWRRAVALCERLGTALDHDEIGVVETAEELWSMVRPFV